MKNKLKNLGIFFKSNLDRSLLIMLVISLPFERIPSFDLLGITLRFSVIIGLFIIARAAFLLYTKKIKFSWNPMYLLLAIFLAWIILLVPESINFRRAIEVVIFNGFVIVLCISISLIYKKEYTKYLIYALFATTLVSCFFAYYQFFGDVSGLSIKITGLAERYTSGLFGFPRVQGFSLEPLYLGSFLLIGIMTSLALLVVKDKEVVKIKTNYVLLFVYTNILFITTARSAIYAFVFGILGMIVIVFFKRKELLKNCFLPLLVIIASFVFALGIVNYGSKLPAGIMSALGKKGISVYTSQLTNTGLDAGDERAISRKQAINIIKSEKVVVLIGIGPGQFGPFITNNGENKNDWPIVNNLPLEILVEEGALGLLLLLAFLVLVMYLTFRSINLKKPISINEVLRLSLLAYLLTQFIQYQAFSTLYVIHLWLVIGLLMGLISEEKIFKKAS